MIARDSDINIYHRGRTVRDPLDCEFIAWDGEGITPPNQSRQNFVLFGNSKGFYVSGNRLTTQECLDLILTTELEYPRAIHVGFAFGYDTEMMLVDLSIKHMTLLQRKGYVKWRGYRIEYRRGKWLQIGSRINGEKVSARIWDVWGFFQKSFLAALDEFLGTDNETLAFVKTGKDARGQFTYDQLDDFIMPYWQAELRLTVDLMNSLRDSLYGADLKIRQWHGPGAIASYALRKNNMTNAMDKEISEEVNRAAQFAYAGGRFELFKIGRANRKVYAYDIRSAYPAAIAELPNLKTGKWSHVKSPSSVARFGVYRIRFSCASLMTDKPMPYFYRDERCAVHFPNVVEGWYWSPEAKIAQYLNGDAVILEGWEYDDDDERPFSWIADVYKQRAEMKRNGNHSQIALKLLMNSIYGKMAQRVGWEATGKPPAWHQLEWAGFVTSSTRAKLFKAMLMAYQRDGLLGVETDGIFSTAELPLDIGESLGQWEVTEYEDMIYLQSGFYFKKVNDEWKGKYRGFDKNSLTVDDAITTLSQWKPWTKERGIIIGTTTRFATMGQYLRMENPNELRNVWQTTPRYLALGADGKRVHRPEFCKACQDYTPADKGMHTLTVTYPVGGLSYPHSLPWYGDALPNAFRDIEEGITEYA